MAFYSTGANVQWTRADIDDLDEQIINLIGRRVRVSAHLQAAKEAAGLPRTDLQRETEIRERYSSALGWHGNEVADALLNLAKRVGALRVTLGT